MPLKSKTYITFVVVTGWAALAAGLATWKPGDWVGFGFYFCVSLIASGYKVRLPGITGTLSACFLLALIGIVSRSVPETLISACAAVLVQCLWHSRQRSKLVRAAFNAGAMALAITASAAVFHSTWLRSLHLEFSVLLLILGGAYFIFNTVPVAGVIALTENTSLWTVWRNGYFWSFPYYLLGAAAAGLFDIAKQQLGWQTAMLIVPVASLIYRSYALHIGRLDDAKKHAEETAALHFRTVESLALAIEAKDQTTHDHLQRVQVYATGIGKELKLGASEMEALRAASLLHDIGKIAVPESILNKPGKLTPEEFQKMKIHPVVGAEIVERTRFPFPVAPIVRCHHEKWDGSGYPAGLKGEAIPIGARIIAVVDCFDALASGRPYRRAMSLDNAMAAVEREKHRSFDPAIVDALKRRYVELEHLARVSRPDSWQLSTNIQIENGNAPGSGLATTAEVKSDPVDRSLRQYEHKGLETLLASASSLQSVLTLREILAIFAVRLAAVVHFDALALYAPQRGALVPAFVTGQHGPMIESLRIPMGQGITGWAAQANRTILNGNPAVEPGWKGAGSLRSSLAIPLQTANGSVGVLALYSCVENGFTAEGLRLLCRLAGSLADCIERNKTADNGTPDFPTFRATGKPSPGVVLAAIE